MDPKSTYIQEALKMQPLSEEEKAARHILGRLYGPIATCTEKTRNGRGYNRALWEKALADDIFKEKIGNKSLFLELGHPADREETDMRCVCACIPEMPKIIDGDLYAYVDILDTDNGRLLKTLCDYGFIPGISSRGSGDVMDNDEVDPETFFLETWDIVQLPAVKKARLAVCESVDSKNIKLTKALHESYAKADKTGKVAIKEACENLGLDVGDIDKDITEDMADTELEKQAKEFTDKFKQANGGKEPTIKDYMAAVKNEALKEAECEPGKCYRGGTPKDIGEIPETPDAWGSLNEDADLDDDAVEAAANKLAEPETEDVSEDDVPDDLEGQMDYLAADEQEAIDGYEKVIAKVDNEHLAGELEKIETEEQAHKDFLDAAKKDPEAVYTEPLEQEENSEEEVEEIEEEEVEESLTEADDAEDGASTVGDMIKQFQDYDEDLAVEFDTIKLGDKEYQVTEMSLDDSEEGKILVGLTCEEVSADADKDIEAEEANDEGEFEDEDQADEEAEDVGADEVIESVKDLIHQKNDLEDANKALEKAKADSDAVVAALTEELNRYKAAFARTSTLAAQNPELKQTIESLKSTVEKQNAQIKALNESVKTAQSTAGQASAKQVKSLTEALNVAKTDAESTKQKLTEELAAQRKQAQQQAKLAQAYKNKCSALVERYLASKAEMLGVQVTEIKGKLKENYSLADIDAVCEALMTSSRPSFSLGNGRRVSVKVNESKSTQTKARNYQDPENGYEIDDSLLELAGLK